MDSLHERCCVCSIRDGGFVRHTLCGGACVERVVCLGVGFVLVVGCGMTAENHAFLPSLLVCYEYFRYRAIRFYKSIMYCAGRGACVPYVVHM